MTEPFVSPGPPYTAEPTADGSGVVYTTAQWHSSTQWNPASTVWNPLPALDQVDPDLSPGSPETAALRRVVVSLVEHLQDVEQSHRLRIANLEAVVYETLADLRQDRPRRWWKMFGR